MLSLLLTVIGVSIYAAAGILLLVIIVRIARRLLRGERVTEEVYRQCRELSWLGRLRLSYSQRDGKLILVVLVLLIVGLTVTVVDGFV